MMLLTALLACDSAPEAPPVVDDPCPEISLDGLAGDWGKVSGSQFDHKVRTRIFKEGDAWQAWYVAGGFRKVAMKGEMRAEDLVLTEDREIGADPVVRLYFQPHKPKCAMRVVEVRVTSTEGKERETQVGNGYTEFVAMPEEPAFTYRPCVADAVVAKAATDWKVAKKELEEGINPVTALGDEVAVTAWTVAEEDGDAACSYDMDLYFDDRAVEGAPVAAGGITDGHRAWPAVFRAPYSGNHHFELYRHRTCEGGQRELIAVSCIEAILD